MKAGCSGSSIAAQAAAGSSERGVLSRISAKASSTASASGGGASVGSGVGTAVGRGVPDARAAAPANAPPGAHAVHRLSSAAARISNVSARLIMSA